MVDRAIAAIFEHGTTPDGRKVRPTCAKGCSACCYEPVYAERSEAQLLASAVLRLPADVRARVLVRAKAWATRFRASPLLKEERPAVMAYRALRLPCPLLEGGECLVYDDRPFGCRAHVAFGPREGCEDDAKRPDQVFMENNDFMAGAITALAAGLARDGRAELLMDHLGALLAEAMLGERVESEARRLLRLTFEPEKQEATHGPKDEG